MFELLRQLDDSGLVCVVKDSYGAFIYWNAQLSNSFVLPEDGMSGKTEYHFMDDKEAAAIRHNDQQVLRTGRTLSAVEFVTLPDGNRTAWLVNKFRISVKRSHYLAVLATALNPNGEGFETRLKVAEEQLQLKRDKYQHILELVVAERLKGGL